MDKRRIAILGSTGSIGRQTLDVIREHRDLFEVEMLTCKGSWELMASQAKEFDANNAVICDETKYKDLADALDGTDTKVFAGMKSVCDLVTSDRVDIVVAAMVGFSGLAPTMAAIGAGKVIALANKETLVAAGSIVMEMSKKYHAPILPVDSEHSAIFQCLLSAQGNAIRKIHLTASGGPFRTWDKERISAATKDMALKHPNWSMGAKITIDSATMMNKGFEVIEARWLFDTPCDRINVVVHPESIIHSMIEYEDGSVIAQLACPDMREPIQFAIGFPERLPLANKNWTSRNSAGSRSSSLTPRSSRRWRWPTRRWSGAGIFLAPLTRRTRRQWRRTFTTGSLSTGSRTLSKNASNARRS